jgi:hypothetical protein
MTGDVGCGGSAGASASVALVGAEPEEEAAGPSPMLCNSGVAGLGTNIVLRTSRRPRSVDDRFGCGTCYNYH